MRAYLFFPVLLLIPHNLIPFLTLVIFLLKYCLENAYFKIYSLPYLKYEVMPHVTCWYTPEQQQHAYPINHTSRSVLVNVS